MTLPSLDEVFTIAFLVIPGFFAFLIFKNLVPNKRSKFSDYEITIYSLIYAFPILGTYYLLTGTGEITDLAKDIFQWSNLIMLAVLTIGWGSIPAIIAKFTFARDQTVGNCWDEFEKEFGNSADLIVYTKDGREWRGWVKRYDCTEDKQELILGDPELIVRNNKMKITKEIKMGQEMLFTEKGIVSISRLNSSNDQTEDAITASGNDIKKSDKIEADKIFDFCLLLVTVLAGALLQYASFLYPLPDIITEQHIAHLNDVNFVFRITSFSIISMVILWIVTLLVPSPKKKIRNLTWFRRRYLKELCWALFGNLLAIEIMIFIYLSYTTEQIVSSVSGNLGIFFSVLLTYFATLYYVNIDRQKSGEQKQEHFLRFLSVVAIEHGIVYGVSAVIITIFLHYSGLPFG